MTPDEEEPEVAGAGPADVPVEGAELDGGPPVRQPPGPDDRPLSDLPPPGGVEDPAGAPPVEPALTGGSATDAEEGPDGLPEVSGPDAPEEAVGDVAAEAEDRLVPEATIVVDGDPGPTDAVVGAATAPEVAEPAGPAEPEESSEAEDPTEAEEPTGADEPAPPEEPTEADAAVALVGRGLVAPAEQARRRSRRRRRLVGALLAVAVVSTTFAVAKTREANDLRAERDDRRAIEVVAARFASAYLSYDFAHVDESGRAVTALATKAFSRSYVAERAPGIQELFTNRQTTTRATTTDVFVGSVARRTARALVVVDVTATSPTDGEQRLDDVSFVLDLARTPVGWRVDAVDRAPQPSVAEGAPVPAP